MLLNHTSIAIQEADVVAAALEHFRRKPPLGFSDCLILEVARKSGHLPLGTFDRALGKLDGALNESDHIPRIFFAGPPGAEKTELGNKVYAELNP
jgi:hypothetical protein